jgi:hypothetical protein
MGNSGTLKRRDSNRIFDTQHDSAIHGTLPEVSGIIPQYERTICYGLWDD